MKKMTVKDLEEFFESWVKDEGGAAVLTANHMAYVFKDVGQERAEEEDIAKALENLVAEGVMERVGRNGFQVREEWLEAEGFSVEDVGV